ncbi:CorA family divalent cation transporter [Cyclobacterium qasimii]|uniref:Magnesium transport protein CorA n=2 Tax=Cyclobacterium qasimii TaxID=1350429 RepID=A0A512CDZ3_9BACT|nr:CorA family divalent cation transporter [Cyclobacterium qasimii]GEO22416.1 magnesium transport protein CorA [Cyclobacterium qasimii]
MKKTITNFSNFHWIDIENPTEGDLKTLDLPFDINENFLEDALESGHLPKFEHSDKLVFIILRAYTATPDERAIEVGQISNKIAFFVYENALLTIHRAPFDFISAHFEKTFDSVEGLVLSLVNEILLTFESPLKIQIDKMDELERQIFLKNGRNISIENLYYEKAKARLTKKILLITQNILNQFKVLDKSVSDLQDIKDTVLDFILKSDEIIDDSNALLNSYISFTAQKNNDVMRLLTVFSAFFLPLTFIVGVYGMNFDKMPELRWQYGYFIILAVMVAVSIIIYIWFKRKKII